MAGSSHSKSGGPGLHPAWVSAVRHGLERTRALRTPLLLRVAVELQDFSPGQFLDTVWRRRGEALALRCVASGYEHYCWGVELEVSASQLDALKPVFEELRAKVVLQDDVECPLVFFGSSFTQGQWMDQGRAPAAPWGDWPHALLRVPAWVVSFDHQRETWALTVNALIRPDFREEDVVRRLSERVVEARAMVRPRTAPPESGAPGVGRPLESEAEWCQRVEGARKACFGPRLRKVVLVRAVEYSLAEAQSWQLAATWEELVKEEADCTAFAFLRKGRALVGATPESLLCIIDGQVETHALAGTAPRGVNAAEDQVLGAALLRSEKDLEEHQVVVRNITEALYPWCDAILVDHRPRLRVLGRVQHLETPINAQLKQGISLFALSAALHPTAALAGAPRGAALNWLDANEALDRGWFGGLLGFVNTDGGGEAWVSIRSALLDHQGGWLFAGAGIIHASDPEGEWQETDLKLQTMARALRCGVEVTEHE